MKMNDQEAIDSADRWKAQDYDLKMKKIQLSDARRRKVMDDLLGVPGFVLALMILILSVIIASSTASWSKEIIDCSKADKKQLENMFHDCEKNFGANLCHQRVANLMCEVRYIYPVEEKAP